MKKAIRWKRVLLVFCDERSRLWSALGRRLEGSCKGPAAAAVSGHPDLVSWGEMAQSGSPLRQNGAYTAPDRSSVPPKAA